MVALESVRLTRIDHISGAVCIGLALTFAHDDVGGVAFGIHLKTVFAGFSQGKCEIGGVDLKHLARLKTAHANIQGALIQLQLCNLVVVVDHGEIGFTIHPDQRTTYLDFCPGLRIRP